MLERDMEIAVANCPELFIESGLSLVRRQMKINGRRPDVVFADSRSHHLLVEIQKGRLDDKHVQRHFYYYYDYRAKYPETHPRLMFLANRIDFHHKTFLDDHSYGYREFSEKDFAVLADKCAAAQGSNVIPFEVDEISEVLPPSLHGIVHEIENAGDGALLQNAPAGGNGRTRGRPGPGTAPHAGRAVSGILRQQKTSGQIRRKSQSLQERLAFRALHNSMAKDYPRAAGSLSYKRLRSRRGRHGALGATHLVTMDSGIQRTASRSRF
jgi:hypothetical protein